MTASEEEADLLISYDAAAVEMMNIESVTNYEALAAAALRLEGEDLDTIAEAIRTTGAGSGPAHRHREARHPGREEGLEARPGAGLALRL